MAKPTVRETRYDFRKGRNTAVSPDLLNPDELVDATNARLVGSYGAFTKRPGCQRMHPESLGASVMGVTQWDAPLTGKQIVAISGGFMYYKNGTDLNAAFTKVTTSGVPRTTANQLPSGANGWTLSPSTLSHVFNPLPGAGMDTTEITGERPVVTVGDPNAGDNEDAADDFFNVQFDVTADGRGATGFYAAIDAFVTIEADINGAGFVDVSGPYTATTSLGNFQTKHYSVNVPISGVTTSLLFRLKLRLRTVGSGDCVGTTTGTVTTAGYPVTWTTGAAAFSTQEPTFFAPFRASAAGAPLVLFMASGGHYFKWTGTALTQLDPLSGAAAMLPTAIISYHTRMFAMTANPSTGGDSYASETPKTLFWSKIGDAESFAPAGKTFGGSAVTDFLTGQHLTALEVIGSSLLMTTADSVMRFTGQSSDDIVISQNTEGISAEVGSIGIQTLKRFENVAAMLDRRGPYVVTETGAQPIGEQVLPDFDALDSANLFNSVIGYHRGAKELFFAVPGANDGGLNKTVFVLAVRLQAWAGPWTYSFGIKCLANYIGANGIENIMAGCSDGYVRLMDVGTLDDVLSNGSGGSNISMNVELAPLTWGDPGMTKDAGIMKLQARLPAGHALQVKTAFDDSAFEQGAFVDNVFDGTLRDYRVDTSGQGQRGRLVFSDASAVAPSIAGFKYDATDMQRP